MKKTIKNLLCSAALALGATAATAQGLQNIIVEEYHTVTAADAAAYNDVHGGGSFPLVAGMKVFRVYVDMAPNYRLTSVFATPNSPLAVNTTTNFWNDDNWGTQNPSQTRRFDEGALFDSYITINTSGTSGGAAGCGSSAAQFGVQRTTDTNGDLTTCGVYPGFTGADGHIPAAFTMDPLVFLGSINYQALTSDPAPAASFGFNNALYGYTGGITGVDPAGTNVAFIGQFTTNGTFSFNLNVALILPAPSTATEEYVHTNPNVGQIQSPLLTFPQVCVPPQITSATSNSPICAGQTLNLNASATGTAPLNYTWTGTGTITNGGTANATVTGAATGNYNVAVSNACGNVNQNVAVTVNPAPSATISYAGSPYCTGGGTASVTLTGTSGGTFTSTAGLSINSGTGAVNLGASTPGIYTVTYTVAAAGGCPQFQTTASITINQSTTNTVTQSACDSYTWSVNGQTYTASGTYTSVTGCSTEILNLTVNIPGTACDDGNPNTENDQLDLFCNCVGTPVGPGCAFNEVELVVLNDAVSIVSYEVRAQGTNVLAANGTVNPGTGLSTQDICLPDGCYYLVVSDNGGNGIVGGGYVLRLAAGNRLIDNAGNMSVSPSQIAANEGFCLPLGSDRLIATSCDKLDWRTAPCVAEYVVADANALVSAQFGVTNSTSGYQMWWYNPNGGYSFKRFQSHSTSNGLTASATRACHFKINAWTGNQLQEGVLYNVKVRGRVAGTYNEWGPACRFILNNTAAQCPQARLNNIAGNQFFSCGVTRPVASNAFVYSTVVRRMQANCNWLNANRYQFRFRNASEGFELVKTSSTWSVNTLGLACGKTYDVDVRASFDNGATWCATGDPYGTVCTLTTTACSFGMAQEATSGTAEEARLSMYPNPNRGDQLFLSIGSIEEGVETVSVDIYDAFGKRVSARAIAAQDGYVNSMVELNGELSAGFYLVNVTAGSASWSERLMVQP